MRLFKIMAGGASVAALISVLAVRLSLTLALVAREMPEPEFEPLPKADKLQLASLAPEVPLPAVTAAPRIPPVLLVQEDDPPRRRDPCSRHGLRKVATHGGKSWRCR